MLEPAGFAGGLGLVLLFAPIDAFAREADFPLVGIDAENLHLDLVADFDHVFGVLDLLVAGLGSLSANGLGW